MKTIILITKARLEKRLPVISDLYALLDLGYLPIVVVSGASENLKKRMESAGIKIYIISDCKYKFPIPFLNKLFGYYRFRKNCLKLLKQYSPIKPILWIEGAQTILDLGTSVKKYDYILQISELHEKSKIQLGAIRRVIHEAKVVFMPEYCRTVLYQVWFGLIKHPVVLPNRPYLLPDHKELQTIKTKYAEIISELEGKKVILYQGGIYASRAPEKIVQAAKNVGGYQMLFIGPVSSPQVIDELKKIDPNLIHVNFLPYPDYLIFASVAYVGCAFYKADSINNIFCAPNKINEYSAYSLPMIGNDIPGLKFIFESTGAGVIVDDNDITSIENGLKLLDLNYSYYKSNANKIYKMYDTKKIIADVINNIK